MQTPTFDPGLTKQVIAPLRRVIGENGKFNVRRRGTTWRDFHPYLHLVNMSWPISVVAVPRVRSDQFAVCRSLFRYRSRISSAARGRLQLGARS
jgi:hypothetical protein